MGKTNYNKISEEVKEEKAAVVEPEVTAEVVEEPAEVKEVKTTKAPKKPKTTKGVVSNCGSLRVRKEEYVKSDNIISVIDAGVEVEINLDESKEDWYKITTKGGVTGFCMKDYITVK